MARILLLALVLLPLVPRVAWTQLLADSTFRWRGYRSESVTRLRIFRSVEKASRPITVVLEELAENGGRSSLDDAPHLVELASRALALAPDSAFWIFHWGSFSYPGAAPSSKELFLRATFRRADSGALGPPFWRLVNRETVRDYTDRAYW